MSVDTVTSQVGPWAMVPAWVLTVGLTGTEVAVYVSLRSFADRTGEAHPHVRTIAERAGVSESATERALRRFRELDLLRSERWHREDGSIGGCHYTLRDVPPADPPGVTVTPPGVRADATLASGVTPPGVTPDGARTHQRTHQGTQGGAPISDSDSLPVVTSPRCEKHKGDTADVPCNACKDARVQHERSKAARRDAIDLRRHAELAAVMTEADRHAYRPPAGFLRQRMHPDT